MTGPDIRTTGEFSHIEKCILDAIVEAAEKDLPAPGGMTLSNVAGCSPTTAAITVLRLEKKGAIKILKQSDWRRVFEVETKNGIFRTSQTDHTDKPTVEIPCLKCSRNFESTDRVFNRICKKCKSSDGWKNAVGIQGFA